MSATAQAVRPMQAVPRRKYGTHPALQAVPSKEIRSPEERSSFEERRKKRRVYDGSCSVFTCLICIMSAYIFGALGKILPPTSYLLGFMMRSKDCDIRAAACNALRLVSRPSGFSVMAAEDCLFDPSGDVQHAVAETLPALGPKYVSVDAYITLVMRRSSNSAVVAGKVAEHYPEGNTSELLKQLDKILQIVSRLGQDDPFFSTLIEKLVTNPNSDTWKAVEILYAYVADTEAAGAERSLGSNVSQRRLMALQGLRKAIRIFFTAKGFSEQFEQLRNDLSLLLIGEQDKRMTVELDRLLEDIDQVLGSGL